LPLPTFKARPSSARTASSRSAQSSKGNGEASPHTWSDRKKKHRGSAVRSPFLRREAGVTGVDIVLRGHRLQFHKSLTRARELQNALKTAYVRVR